MSDELREVQIEWFCYDADRAAQGKRFVDRETSTADLEKAKANFDADVEFVSLQNRITQRQAQLKRWLVCDTWLVRDKTGDAA